MSAVAAAWRARLALRFRDQQGRTVLAERRHEGPLVVQRAFHPEGPVCHVYLVHPPGGIVGGDDLQLTATAEPGSRALLTTPAATRFYRSGPHPRARLHQILHASDSHLEWLPQETICFDGARAAMRTEVHLSGEARFIGWEVLCLGRPASDESFRTGSLQQDFLVHHEGTPLFLDRLRLQGSSPALQAGWGFAGATACGSFIAFRGAPEQLDALREIHTPGVDAALTLVDGLLHCRATGAEGESVRRHFTALWTLLRPSVLQRIAAPPRIWAT